MKILGIHHGHNSTVGLCQDGQVIFCQSEERLDRMKNSTGWPTQTMAHIQKAYGPGADLAVFGQSLVPGYLYLKKQGFRSARYTDYFSNTRARTLSFYLKYFFFKYLPGIASHLMITRTRRYEARVKSDSRLQKEALDYFSRQTGLPTEKLIFMDHHRAHAYSTLPNLRGQGEHLVFTLDAEGDGSCATVNLYHNNTLQELSRTEKFYSLGHLYAEITGFMGMRPNEDEFKVMGLAPYAKADAKPIEAVAQKLRDLLWLTPELTFISKIPAGAYRYYVYDNFAYTRFDHLAAGLQLFLEEIVLRWVRAWCEKTGVWSVALSGGVFMNVKLNQRIGELEHIQRLFVMPSAGDESTVFGAIMYGWEQLQNQKHSAASAIQPISDLYLGTQWSNEAIAPELAKLAPNRYQFEKLDCIEERIADLLSRDEVVARFSGRMEWGARSLGNRSILANPSSRESVQIINEMIKNRDFWMPFAASILEEDANEYLANPKQHYAPYMTITMNGTERAKRELVAGLHQYDFTCRPQLVRKQWNPRYHDLISRFKQKTGIGGVLNTSFNLHGHPVAESPADALEVLEKSGLRYLAIGDYLVTKL